MYNTPDGTIGQARNPIARDMLMDIDNLISISNEVCDLAAMKLKPIMSNPMTANAEKDVVPTPLPLWPPLFSEVRERIATVRQNLLHMRIALNLCETD